MNPRLNGCWVCSAGDAGSTAPGMLKFMPRLNLGVGGVADGAAGMSRSMPKLNLGAGGGCVAGRDIPKLKPDSELVWSITEVGKINS